jgi:hypothetical protein
MMILRAPSGASDSLAHAIELINRDLDGVLEGLDTHRQNEFWTDLHQYALTKIRGRQGNDARLIVSDHVNTAVREALEMADEKIVTHLRELDADSRAGFWQMLHDAAEQQIRDTKHPKARHGEGGQSA